MRRALTRLGIVEAFAGDRVLCEVVAAQLCDHDVSASAGTRLDLPWCMSQPASFAATGRAVLSRTRLACVQIGLWNVVSVPDGAPAPSTAAQEAGKKPDNDRKFSYLQSCQKLLQSMEYANEVRAHHRTTLQHRRSSLS